MRRLTVLVVDDDQDLARALRILLAGAGFRVALADGVRTGVAAFEAERPDLALLDHALGDGTAFDLIDAFARIDPRVPIVLFTGAGTIELAVQAMKRGARDFLPKSAAPEAVLAAVQGALPPGGAGELAPRPDPFVGKSAAIRALAAEATRIAASASPVLIGGETGTGKSVLARWLHDHGPRASRRFLEVSCAGRSRELLDAELFGHERGAFPGADATRPGLLEAASGGTLFLDEIGDLDAGVQRKLLEVLEQQRFRRVGGVHDLPAELRLVVATHRDLAERVRAGAFRADLYYRIGALPLRVPALRERPEDVPELAERLLALTPARARGVTLSPAALDALSRHPWPGNLRELRNVLERAVLRCEGRELRPEDLRLAPGPEPAAPAAAPAAPDATLRELERSRILQVLAEERYRVPEAARRLGIPRSTLYQKVKELGVQLPRSRRRS